MALALAIAGAIGFSLSVKFCTNVKIRWYHTFFFIVFAWALIDDDLPLDYLIEQYTDSHSKTEEVWGVGVHYSTTGPAPPHGKGTVVLLHGTAASLHTWEGWVHPLRDAGFRVARVDLPGFGLTGPVGDYGMLTKRGYVNFVREFLQNAQLLRGGPVYLVGNSLGGQIAWHYAVEYPEDVAKLVLVNAAAFAMPLPFVFSLAKVPVIGHLLKVVSPRPLIAQNVYEVYGNDDLVTEETISRYHDLLLRPGNRDALYDRIHMIESPTDDEILARLARIKCPTMVMWGEEDLWIPLTMGYRLYEGIPEEYRGPFVAYHGVGHIPMEEIPGQSVADVIEFFIGQSDR